MSNSLRNLRGKIPLLILNKNYFRKVKSTLFNYFIFLIAKKMIREMLM